MLVKEILSLAAKLLGREDLAAVGSGSLTGEAATLLECYNMTENEIALDHLPLKAEETVAPEQGAIAYARLSRPPLAILRVRGKAGEVDFTVFPAELRVPPDAGEVCVTYAYAPVKKTASSEAEPFCERAQRALVYGTACEFCLSKGQYQEAEAWRGRFREALASAGALRRRLRIRGRRWV